MGPSINNALLSDFSRQICDLQTRNTRLNLLVYRLDKCRINTLCDFAPPTPFPMLNLREEHWVLQAAADVRELQRRHGGASPSRIHCLLLGD